MDYTQLNELLKDLNDFRYKNRDKILNKVVERELDEEGEQGETGLSYEVYRLPFDSEYFLKLTINTDSYGYNEFVNGIAFVKPTQKTVTVYE